MTYQHAHPSHPAIREIDALNRSFAAGDYTQDEFADALENVIARHGAKKVVLKRHSNGLCKLGILTPENILVAEYTDTK